jgi:integrase
VINKHLKPHFGSMLLTKITLREVHQFEKKLEGLSAKTVKNYLTLLIAMLNQAVELGYLNTVPTIKKPKVAQEDYSWLRTTDEIRKLLVAAEAERDGVMQLYAAAVYTGMRAGELAGLRWADVDFNRRLIAVQRSFDSPTKTGQIRHLPLLDPLVPVLKAWRLRCPDPWIFPGETGKMLGKSARVFQEVFQRCMVRAKLAVEDAPTEGRLTFHDLRHTLASHWVMQGGDLFRLQKILGHADTKMTMRYAHLAPEAFQGDWGRMKDAVPKEGNVLAMEGADEAAG